MFNKDVNVIGFRSKTNLGIRNNCLKVRSYSDLGFSYDAEDYKGIEKNQFFAGGEWFKIIEVEIYTVNQWKKLIGGPTNFIWYLQNFFEKLQII